MDNSINGNYIESVQKIFRQYKNLGDKAIEQIEEDKIHWQLNEDSNSISILVKHISGNMLSRWTDFFISDGEKEWRNRDEEFINDLENKKQLLQVWEKGWHCLFSVIDNLAPSDLSKIVHIRNEPHTVIDAINRQIAHYSYHVGQLVHVAKQIKSSEWKSLSIPKGQSQAFNKQKFEEEQKKKSI